MIEKDVALFLMLNEPSFEVGEVQYSVCCPGNGYSTWDSDGNTFDYPDLSTLLNHWMVGGKPFRDRVEKLMSQYKTS